MTPLSQREVTALTELCNRLIAICIENSHKITALERSLKAHPAIQDEYRKELDIPKQVEPGQTLRKALQGLEQALMGHP